MKLYQSPVQFIEEPHQYLLNGKELSGITKILHDLVFPDMYPSDIPEFVLKRAAALGGKLHRDLQFRFLGLPIDYPMAEVELYENLVEQNPWMQKQIASEYIISDERSVASAIDAIYYVNEQTVILADFKRTSVLQTPYLEYQLSTYAALFELANPEIKVGKLMAIHLRQEKNKSISRAIEINRIPNEVIWQLIFSYQLGLPKFENPYICNINV